MVLFLRDWSRYPTAIIDTQTTNTTWVRMAATYRAMGVKNNSFMLALINPELQGVDPFSPILTLEQKLAIAAECKINPWYYFREIARASPKSGNEVSVFECNRGNMALFWLFFNHVTLFLIQIRQSGKSFSMDSLAVYLMNIRCMNTQINLLTKDDTLRANTIERIKLIDLQLPVYLRQRGKGDLNNTEGISIKSFNNTYQAHVPQKSAKMALNVGRGLTSAIFFIDEAPFQSNIHISLGAAVTAGTRNRDEARKAGEPYGTIITTTAGKRDTVEGKFIYGMLQEAADWSERFLDAENLEELEKMVRANSSGGKLQVNCTFSHKQLGKTDQWLARAIEESLERDPEAINRDFFNKWTVGTMSSPLPQHVLEKIRAGQQQEQHIRIDAPYPYATKWFIPENEIEYVLKTRPHVLSVDSSDAQGGDAISFLLIDIATGAVTASGMFNETNLITFSEWLCTWFVNYDLITGIIERKSSGVAILDFLLLMLPGKGIDPFRRLFNRCVNDHEEMPDRYKEINVPLGRRHHSTYVLYKSTFGFATAGSGLASRGDLYSKTLQAAAKVAGDKIKDVTTINQLVGLMIINGRVDHASGEHDDMVIAWLLSFWLMMQGKNLAFYGIDSRTVLSETRVEEITDARTYNDRQEQQQIRSDIEAIYERLGNERDEYIVKNLERQLYVLNRKLVLEEGEKFSVDDLINSVRESRRTSRLQTKDSASRYDQYLREGQSSFGVPKGARHEVRY